MPASPAEEIQDKAAIRVLAAAVGQREAARQLGLSENTVKSICYRAGDGRAVKAAERVITEAHPNAPNAADTLAGMIRTEGDATRLAGMRYAKRTVEHAAQLAETAPDVALAQASDVKAALQSAAIAGDWASEKAGDTMTLQFFSVAPVQQQEPEQDTPVIDV